MSTPNKRDERREARKAQITNAQAARRQPIENEPQSVAEDEPISPPATQITTPPVVARIAEPQATVNQPSATEQQANEPKAAATVTKKPTTPVQAGTNRGTVKTATTPSKPVTTTRPVPNVGTTKTPTRPTVPVARSTTAGAGTTANRTATTEATEDSFVTKRDIRRDAHKASIDRVRAERRQRLALQKRKETIRRVAIGSIVAFVVLLFVIWAWLLFHSPVKTVASLTGSIPTNGYASTVRCDPTPGTAAVYHADLQIIINGVSQPPPANIGIPKDAQGTSTCEYWLHTTDTSGVITVASPEKNGQYLLGDFLTIWSNTTGLSSPQGKVDLLNPTFFGQLIDKNHPLHVYVDGKEFTGDPNQLIIRSHENIWLEYGNPIVTAKPFDFAKAGLSK